MLNLFRIIFGMLIFSNIAPIDAEASSPDSSESQASQSSYQAQPQFDNQVLNSSSNGIRANSTHKITDPLNPTDFDSNEVYEQTEATDLCGNW